MGRPRKEIDAEGVQKLAALGCTQDEIGEYFGVDQSTISRRFASEFILGRSICKTSLRRLQWRAAAGGSSPMLIHLGKQYLDQSDRMVAEVTGKDGAPLVAVPSAETVSVALDILAELGLVRAVPPPDVATDVVPDDPVVSPPADRTADGLPAV